MCIVGHPISHSAMAKELISVVEGAQVWFEHQQRLLHQAQPALAGGWAEGAGPGHQCPADEVVDTPPRWPTWGWPTLSGKRGWATTSRTSRLPAGKMQRNLPQLLHLEPEGKGAGGGQELLHLLGAGWACQSLQSNFRLLPPLSQGEKPDDPQAGVGNPEQ